MPHGYWLGPQGTRGSQCPDLSPCAQTIGSLFFCLRYSTIRCVTGTPDLVGGAAAPLCVLRTRGVPLQLRVLDLRCVLIMQGMRAIRGGAVMSSISLGTYGIYANVVCFCMFCFSVQAYKLSAYTHK